jgi:predicted TIM-barrel fold metal-dependent hydrolase
MNAQVIVDADGHVVEPYDLWETRFPPALRDRAPRGEARSGHPVLDIDGVAIPPERSYRQTTNDLTAVTEERFKDAVGSGYSARSQLAGMDLEGIDASVLFPSTGLVVMGVDGVDPLITTTAATVYNDWLAEFCAHDPGRLFGAAMIDPRDVDGAIGEARRAVGDLGMVAVYVRPNPVSGRQWHHPDYEPLWSALEELDVPLCFHEGGSVLLPQIGTDRFEPHAFWHCCTHPMEQQLAMVAMLMGGVAERHPDLRIAFLECGAGWLPYWMWRMDEHVEEEHVDFGSLSLMPSEYVARQCFVSIDSDEHTGIAALDTLHDAHVVWGSDYPHHDAKFPHALKTVSSLPGMTDARRQAVLHDNPLAMFGGTFGARVRAR